MSLVALSPGTVTLTLLDADQTQQLVLSVGTPGPAGPAGGTGPAGANGAPGVGVPAGGSTGQALVKSSSTDYATQWATPASAAVWGGITGTLSAQGDLNTALSGKFNNPAGDTTQYIAGDGTLITFPTLATANKLTAIVYNQTGATLTKGTVVYINGAHGNLPTVAKSLASGEATSAGTYGFVSANIGNMSSGTIVIAGLAENLDTHDFADGDKIYLSPTVAGAWTTTKPSAPNHMVYLGVITRSHPTQGTIQLRIANGFEVAELHDAAISSPANNDLFVYELSTTLWKNKSAATLGLATTTDLADYLPLAGGTMDNNALLAFNDTTTTSTVGINGNGIVTTLAPSPSEYSQLTYNGLLLTNGADTLSLSPTAITFPDASVQTTAAVTFTGGTLSSIVAVSNSGGTASLGTDSGGSISVTDLLATTTTKVTYSGITFSDSTVQSTAAVAPPSADVLTANAIASNIYSMGYGSSTWVGSGNPSIAGLVGWGIYNSTDGLIAYSYSSGNSFYLASTPTTLANSSVQISGSNSSFYVA